MQQTLQNFLSKMGIAIASQLKALENAGRTAAEGLRLPF
jgi:hypothetical protein